MNIDVFISTFLTYCMLLAHPHRTVPVTRKADI